MHAGTLQTGADGHLATRLQHAGGGTQTLGVELRVAHSLPVAPQILNTVSSFLGVRGVASDGGEKRSPMPRVEVSVPPMRPHFSVFAAGSVEGLGRLAQVFLDM